MATVIVTVILTTDDGEEFEHSTHGVRLNDDQIQAAAALSAYALIERTVSHVYRDEDN